MAKVILLDQYAGLGGGQRILADLAGAFRRNGHEVRVFLPGEGTTSSSLKAEGFPVLDLPLPAMSAGRKSLLEKVAYPFHARKAAGIVARKAASWRADLIYANAPRCFLPGVLAARRTGIPLVCGLHLIFTGGLEHRLVGWCFRQPQVKGVIFCSGAVAGPFKGACAEKGLKLHYWVSPAILDAPSGRVGARQAFGLGRHEVAVGVLGRISRTKGQRLFLEALLPLLPAHPRLKLLVAGTADFEDPGEEEAVCRLAEEASDPSRVVVTGRMVDSLTFLDALDCLVVPSMWEEPFGLVAVEGMARGLPVVVTRSGGLTEIVEDGVTGFHADKSARSLRETIEPLLEDAPRRTRMGEEGKARVERLFNPAIQLERLVEFALG